MKICIRKQQAVVSWKKADVNLFKTKLEEEKKVRLQVVPFHSRRERNVHPPRVGYGSDLTSD